MPVVTSIKGRIFLWFGSLLLLALGVLQGITLFGLPATPWSGAVVGVYQSALDDALNALQAEQRYKRQMVESFVRERRRDLWGMVYDSQLHRYLRQRSRLVAGSGETLDVLFAHADNFKVNERLSVYNGLYGLHTSWLVELDPGRVVAQAGSSAEQAPSPSDTFLDTLRRSADAEAIRLVHRDSAPHHLLQLGRRFDYRDSAGASHSAALVVMLDVATLLGPLLNYEVVNAPSELILLVDAEQHPIALVAASGFDGPIPEVLPAYSRDQVEVVALGGGDGIANGLDHRGVDVLAAYGHVRLGPELTLQLIISRPRRDVLSQVWGRMGQYVWVDLLALILVLLFSWLAARRLMEPLVRLGDAVGRMEQGELSARAPPLGHDELGQLAQNFNAMGARLQGWHEALDVELRARTLALRESEQRTRHLVEHINAVTWEYDLQEGRFIYFSPHVERMLGYPVAHFQGHDDWLRIVDARDRERLAALSRQALGQGSGFDHVYRVRTATDEVVWVRESVTLSRDEQGEPRGLLGFMIDISDSKARERELYESRARQRAIFDNAGAGIAICTLRGLVVEANAAYASLVQRDPQAMAGLDTESLIHPDDLANEQWDRARLLSGEAGTARSERRYLRTDGSTLWLDQSISVGFDRSGTPSFLISVVQDIDLRKRTEVDLYRWKQVFENAGWGIAVTPIESDCLLQINPAFAQLHGYRVEELLGRPYADLVPPELHGKMIDAGTQLRRDGALVQEGVHLTKAGHRLPVLTNSRIVYDPHGAALLQVTSVEDISPLRQVEEALRMQQHNLSALLENTDSSIWSVDRELRLVIGNSAFSQACEALYGHAPVAGESVLELETEPVERERWRDFYARALTGETFDQTLWVGRRYIRFRFRPIQGEEGHAPVAGVTVGGVDLTDQQEARELLRRHNAHLALLNHFAQRVNATLEVDEVLMALLSELLDAIGAEGSTFWQVDATQGEVVCRLAAGRAAERVEGLSLPLTSGIIGWVIAHNAAVEVADTRLDARHTKRIDLATGIEVRSLIYNPLLRGGQVYGVLSAMHTRPGAFDSSALGLMQTLAATASSALNNAYSFDQLQRLKHDAEAANRAKSAFLANMSHELRTPLNAMLGHAQILARDPGLGEGPQQSVATIQRSGDYLLALINDVLDLAKVEAGRFDLDPNPTDLHAFFDAIARLFAIRAHDKGIAFTHHPFGHFPKRVMVDDKRLRQVVMNLIGNAIKFTERGGVTLETEFAEGVLRIEVVDSGIGIRPGQLQRLFQPFQQEGSQAYRSQGTGLGLAISKSLCDLMGGRIEVESTPGEGSRFRVKLPLQAIEGEGATAADTPPLFVGQRYRRLDGKGGRFTLLVVDDLLDNRTILRGLLTPFGFQVVEADGGESAVRLAQRGGIDLVLMDLVMPDINGLETTQRIHALPGLRSLPVVACTASTFPEDRRNAEEAGCIGYLPKPVRLEELQLVLAQCLPLVWEAGEAPAAASDAQRVALCEAQREALRQLVKVGNLQGIRRLLAELEGEADEELVQLRAASARYDLRALRELLERS